MSVAVLVVCLGMGFLRVCGVCGVRDMDLFRAQSHIVFEKYNL